jgi:hypothetical protein
MTTSDAFMILGTFDGTSKYLSDDNRFGTTIECTRTSRIATDVRAPIEPVHCIVGIDYHHFCRLANRVRRECGEEERKSRRASVAVTFGSRSVASRADDQMLRQGLLVTSCSPWRSGDFPVCDDTLAAFQSDEAFG